MPSLVPDRHPGAGRDRTLTGLRTGKIPAGAGMTDERVAENAAQL